MARYFSLSEMLRSETADRNHICNTPSNEVRERLNYLMEQTLDPIREMWGRPIGVNSGFRSKALNTAIKGAVNSQHLTGEAADITTGSVEGNKKLFDMIIASSIPFDQCIDEKQYKWIHVSCRHNAVGNRRQVLHL